MSRGARPQSSGHIFGGRHAEPDPRAVGQVDAPSPAQRASARRPSQAQRVAVSNVAREALVFVASCVGIGVLGVLLYDILRAVRRR